MGAADVIPGVSGGTIAFLTGIYEELLNSIKAVDFQAVKLLFTGHIKQFWTKINGTFLFSLLAGIFISFMSLAKLMTYLMEYHPIPLWSFFFGLIISSAIFILRDIKKWSFGAVISLLIGVAIGATICLLSPSETPSNLWFIFLCGAIAICAMILPGISGSFILLLLGKYEYMLAQLTEFNIVPLIVFVVGAALGIIAFSHILSWLLKRFYTSAICLLSGFMVGSLLKVWPWQIELASGVSRPILPNEHIIQALIFVIIGVSIVFIIEMAAKKLKNKE